MGLFSELLIVGCLQTVRRYFTCKNQNGMDLTMEPGKMRLTSEILFRKIILPMMEMIPFYQALLGVPDSFGIK